MRCWEEILYHESGRSLEEVGQRSCRCPMSGNVQGQNGWGFGQPHLVGGVPVMAGRLIFKVSSWLNYSMNLCNFHQNLSISLKFETFSDLQSQGENKTEQTPKNSWDSFWTSLRINTTYRNRHAKFLCLTKTISESV